MDIIYNNPTSSANNFHDANPKNELADKKTDISPKIIKLSKKSLKTHKIQKSTFWKSLLEKISKLFMEIFCCFNSKKSETIKPATVASEVHSDGEIAKRNKRAPEVRKEM